MRVVFMGTPDFAVPSLEALVDSRHDVACVVTQPDRPAGRGRKLTASPVARAAESHSLPTEKPERFRAPDFFQTLSAIGADLFAVVAFGEILRKKHLELPPEGCVNVHPSLLPRHRGPIPIQAALLAGDDVTGVTTMRMDRGVDTGEMFLQEAVEIGAGENAGTLHDRLAVLGATLLVRTLDGIEAGSVEAVAQPDHGATLCGKIEPEDRVVDWSASALDLYRRVRALTPWPGVNTSRAGTSLRLVSVEVRDLMPCTAAPGTLVSTSPLVVACGIGSLTIRSLKPAGSREMDADAFVRGHEIRTGEVWGGEER